MGYDDYERASQGSTDAGAQRESYVGYQYTRGGEAGCLWLVVWGGAAAVWVWAAARMWI